MSLVALKDIRSELRIVPYEEIRARQAILRRIEAKPPAAIQVPAPEPEPVKAIRVRKIKRDYLFVSTVDPEEVELAFAAIRDRGRAKQYLAQIVEELCDRYNVTKVNLLSARRTSALCMARNHIWWLLKRDTPWSFPQIGRVFDRDHTSVIHGVQKFQKDLDEGRVTL